MVLRIQQFNEFNISKIRSISINSIKSVFDEFGPLVNSHVLNVETKKAP